VLLHEHGKVRGQPDVVLGGVAERGRHVAQHEIEVDHVLGISRVRLKAVRDLRVGQNVVLFVPATELLQDLPAWASDSHSSTELISTYGS
jgi:hypothetical protein